MHCGEIDRRSDFILLSRRVGSLSRSSRLLVYGSLALVTVAISLGFALRGAWLALPFAGLECVALYLAARWLARHQGDYECIAIDGDRLIVETCDRGEVERCEFSRVWAQVVVEGRTGGRLGVFLRSHGREMEVGRLLTEDAKLAIARQLRQKLRTQGLS